MLFNTNLRAKQSYDWLVTGLSPSAVRDARAQAADMAGFQTMGRCTSTVNAIFYGDNEPATACLQRQVKEWIHTWKFEVHAQARLRQGWQHILDKFQHMRPRGRWNTVPGPMGSFILALQQLGWKPLRPDLWEDPHCNQWKFCDEDELDFKDIMQAIAKDMDQPIWSNASHHYYGKGMQHGMDTTMLKRTIQRLRKADRAQEAGAL